MKLPNTDNPSDERLPKGVYGLSLIAGLLVAILGAKSVIQDFRVIQIQIYWSEHYTATTAKILKVGIRAEGPNSSEKFYPEVLYEYFVDGKSVWGWRFSFEEEPKSHAFWETRLSHFHVHDSVVAFVNPKDAKDSFIEPKRDSLLRVYLKAIVGLGFVAAGILFCWLPITRLIRNNP